MNSLIKIEGNTWMYFHVCKCWFKITDSFTIELALSMCVCVHVSFITYFMYKNQVCKTYRLYATEKWCGSIF